MKELREKFCVKGEVRTWVAIAVVRGIKPTIEGLTRAYDNVGVCSGLLVVVSGTLALSPPQHLTNL